MVQLQIALALDDGLYKLVELERLAHIRASMPELLSWCPRTGLDSC